MENCKSKMDRFQILYTLCGSFKNSEMLRYQSENEHTVLYEVVEYQHTHTHALKSGLILP